MAEYFVHHTGDNSTGASWATAFTSVDSADTAVAFASGDILNIGHDHVCPVVHAASLTITGPSSGLPAIFRSVTTGSDPVTYQKGTGTQIDTTEAATYDITFDGSFALYGMFVKAGRIIYAGNDHDEGFYCKDCTFAPGVNSWIQIDQLNGNTIKRFVNLIVDLSQDGTTNRAATVFQRNGAANCHFDGLTFINPEYRTGNVFQGGANAGGGLRVSGADFSGFTNATACELFYSMGETEVTNSKTAATFTLVLNLDVYSAARVVATNVGPADSPTYLQVFDYHGTINSSTSIYRSGGATIEGIANSWLVTTTANCNEYAPFHSPWIYGVIGSTGTLNFDLHITNDVGDLLDSEAWLEVERLATAGSPLWTLASDQRATITTTPVAQDDDTTSVWNGPGPTYAFKQRLRVTAAVGETGQFRARLVTGVASIASSRNYYADPVVVVSVAS